MSSVRGNLLIGKIALGEGLVTRGQLYDCLIAQERNPSRPLGAIMVSRGYLKNDELDYVLDLQRRAFEAPPDGPAAPTGNALFGRILVDRGLATEYQVNECLRLQGRLAELGIKPLPLLGEILVSRGYLTREAVESALQLQNLRLYSCPECGLPVETDDIRREGACRACGARLPFLFTRMASAVEEALERASRELDVEPPPEVRHATGDPARSFGKYILVHEIGRGGAGIVYKAWQRDLGRIVALKVLPHESDTAGGVKTPFGDVEDLKRFYNETRAHADLEHPNIVPILDFGVVDNHFYYTMGFVEGVTLDGVVREGAPGTTQRGVAGPGATPSPARPRDSARIVKGRGMPVGRALEIIREVALAVDYAHGRGVYHRDIKPSNIIIDLGGKPWLMDFGLAKVTHIGDAAYVKGIIMGTPYYMPPEQARGDMEQVDNLSDIYSLGAVLYEMVSGYSPHTGKTPDEVLEALAKGPPEPVSSHAPALPADLVRAIEKAMHFEKSGRYPSARAFAEDIALLMSGRPPHPEPRGAGRRSLWARLRSWLGRGG